jgi:multiple sugar transport system permease protein
MSLIPIVGQKSARARIFIAALYIVLTLGAVTMVYPFLIMLSTSVRSEVDVNDYSVIPPYLRSDASLFSKYSEIKYAVDLDLTNGYYGRNYVKCQDIRPPQATPLSPQQLNLVHDWRDFSRTLDLKFKLANFGPIPIYTAPSRLLDNYRGWLKQKFSGDIIALDRAYREDNSSFDQTAPPFQRPTSRDWQPGKTMKDQDWIAFEKTLPDEGISVVECDPLFSTYLKQDIYAADISRLNAAYGAHYKSFDDVHISASMPTGKAERSDWEHFVRAVLPFRYMILSPKADPAYRAFLSSTYSGKINLFNRSYGTAYQSFEQIPLPSQPPATGIALTDWKEFIAKYVPADAISVNDTEESFREFVLRKYGSVEAANRRYGLKMVSLRDLTPPCYISDWDYVLTHRGELRRHFLARNYAMVFSFILFHSRAVINTIIFCLAVILTQLTVNPLCAYALSRYNLSYAYKVLLFLLATMAFPAEVAMIPNFLLLKQLNMLNTYWALVLPGVASGFAIFLLKGFFDSLPKELYEAGIIDGASEPVMFRKITMPLSKPIFAVIALQAFTSAYGAFMFAFLVCQNPKMWTMMVWLYELQITAPKYVTMAALTVTALPTLVIFILCQNVIMRGIILPSFK